MGSDLNIYKPFLLSLSKDSRITVWHLAAMLAVIQLANGCQFGDPIFVSRKRIMQLSHINSISTFHKCINELKEFGYIDYLPSYHPGIRSKVFLLNESAIKDFKKYSINQIPFPDSYNNESY